MLTYEEYKKNMTEQCTFLSLKERKHYDLPHLKIWNPEYLTAAHDNDIMEYFLFLPLEEKVKMLKYLHKKSPQEHQIFLKCLNYCMHYNADEEHMIAFEPYEEYIEEKYQLSFYIELIKNKKRDITVLKNYPDVILSHLMTEPKLYEEHRSWLSQYFDTYIETSFHQKNIIDKITLCLELSSYDPHFLSKIEKDVNAAKKALNLFFTDRHRLRISKQDFVYPILCYLKPTFSLEARITIFHQCLQHCPVDTIRTFIDIEDIAKEWIPEYELSVQKIIHDAFNAYGAINRNSRRTFITKEKEKIFKTLKNDIEKHIPDVLSSQILEKAQTMATLINPPSLDELNQELCQLIFSTEQEHEISLII